MSSLHKSLDETLAAIREHHEEEMRACKDKMLAAEVKAALLEEQLHRANEARAASDRLAMKLVTQFSVVEAVFAEAKALALSVYAELEKKTDEPTGDTL